MLENRVFLCWCKGAGRELFCRGVVCDRRVGRNVFVSRVELSDWWFGEGRSEVDDVLLTNKTGFYILFKIILHVGPIKTSGKESQGPLLARMTRPWSIMILAQKFTTSQLTTVGDVRSLALSIEDGVLYPKSPSDSLSHLL